MARPTCPQGGREWRLGQLSRKVQEDAGGHGFIGREWPSCPQKEHQGLNGNNPTESWVPFMSHNLLWEPKPKSLPVGTKVPVPKGNKKKHTNNLANYQTYLNEMFYPYGPAAEKA